MILIRCGVQFLIVDEDSPFFQKAYLDLLAFLIHSDHYSGFLGNHVHRTNLLAIRYGVDDFYV